jgi:hypothetical protein
LIFIQVGDFASIHSIGRSLEKGSIGESLPLHSWDLFVEGDGIRMGIVHGHIMGICQLKIYIYTVMGYITSNPKSIGRSPRTMLWFS